ncbi:MAG: autotransporter domain-containing protein, partial [Gammaproteobacteria bacterium]
HSDAAYQFANAGGSPIIVNGFAQLNQIGTGTTYLGGVQNYTGNTTISDGQLIVNGSAIASSFYLNGGVLGGNGTTGPVYVNGGTLAPGNSIGTLNVAAIDFSGGGVYEVEVDAAGNSDRINVSGTATLGGGRVSVLPMPGNYANQTQYTILSAATLNGVFDSVSVDLPEFAYLDAALAYTSNDVLLTLSRNDVAFGFVAANANQWAVGSALTQLAGDPGVSDINNALTVLSVADAQSALQSLSGDIHAYGQMLSLEANRQFGAGALDIARLRTQRGLWLQGFGSDGEFDRDHGSIDTDTRHSGAALGYDTAMGNTVWGIAAGYSQSAADAGPDDMDVDSIHAGIYAQWQQGYHYLKGSVVGGQHEIETSRSIAVGSLLAQADSDSDAVSAGLDIEGGHTFPWQGSTASITPFVGLGYGWLQRDAFVETGAGQANLDVHEDNFESLRSRVGARFQYAWALANGIRIEPAVELAWVHEYLEEAVGFRAGFAGAPIVGFGVTGPELDRDRAQVGVGVNVMFPGASQLEFNYRGDIAGSDEQHAAYLTYRMMW